MRVRTFPTKKYGGATRLGLQGNSLANFLLGQTFDWYDHSFRTGLNQNYNVSMSGATDRVNYYFSLGYMDNEGVAVGNDYTTFRSNMKVNAKSYQLV